jgi:hypothetical protein
MTEHVASRTLVKSPPELWAECSDATSLARHLDGFGEIRITRLEPETAVAWEGERARGTVRIEPSGWGTKVILTAVAEGNVSEEPVVEVMEEPVVEVAEEPVLEVAEEPVLEVAEEPVLEVAEEPVVGVAEEPMAEVPEPVETTQPLDAAEPPPVRRRRFARFFGRFRAPEPAPASDEPAEAEPPDPERALVAFVDPISVAEPEPEELATEPEPEPGSEPEPATAAAAASPASEAPAELPATEAALTAALDSLGQAHHRPYSRA